MRPTVAIFLFLCIAAGPAGAQSLMPGPNAAGRYQMQPVEGGVARLDTVTGEVSLCRIEDGTLRCRPGKDGAEPAPPPGAASIDPQAKAAAEDDAEFDKAVGRMKRFFRAFHDIAREFEDGRSAPDAPAPERS